MIRKEAVEILHDMTKGESLRRHAVSVACVMEAYASKLGQDEDQWYIAGLLHDADYEQWPEKHPNLIVNLLNERGEKEIAHAISAHYSKWGKSYDSLLDKALIACDEITGFIIACCQVRPDGIDSLKVSSVKKKLKSKGFAASVERSEVTFGAEKLGVPLEEHIAFIIETLRKHKQLLLL